MSRDAISKTKNYMIKQQVQSYSPNLQVSRELIKCLKVKEALLLVETNMKFYYNKEKISKKSFLKA